MNGSVNKLCDINSITIPKELTEISVDEQQVEDGVRKLSLRYADRSTADVVQKGDTVYCKADKESYPDGRTVILYTDSDLPGAEIADKDVLGKKAEDIVSTKIKGKDVALTVEKIVRSTPAKINDDLIKKIGIAQVTSLDEYRDYVRNKIAADLHMEKEKEIVRYIMDEMEKGSTYIFNQDEMDRYVKDSLKEYMSQDIDEDMDMPEEEIEKSIISQEKQNWIVKAFCQERNVEIDMKAAEEQADQMMEMMNLMGEDVPDRSEAVEMAVQNEYFDAFFTLLDSIISEKTGGAYGNG